ncbi:MAG: Molybdopterin synthase catalytic subunit [Promethearchaeota archaeon]|nr:MAG: Molybdopterin synthase catalytic subunit [Candidatus Lokiarchaeota archaeon]
MKNITSGIYEKGAINLNEIMNSLKNQPQISNVGSILSFTGIVRNTSKEGNSVSSLTIDAYDELANKSIEKICNKIKKRQGIIDLKLIHLKGSFKISEDLVYVVVASAHREEGFKALRDTVERYKTEIEVWKKEELCDGSSDWHH